MRTLFIVAEMQEAKPLIEFYKLEKCSRYQNWWMNENCKCFLIVTGPGVNNVISSLSKATYCGFLSPKADIINVGYAGAKGINVGEVVEIKACHCLEFPTKANTGIENCVALSKEGYDCYTSFDFVENADNIEGKALFDMELAYIARFAHNSLYSIKIVSDSLNYDGFKNFDGDKAWKEVIAKIEERRKTNVSRNIAT